MPSIDPRPPVADPDVGAVGVLLGDGAGAFLAEALEAMGARLRSFTMSQVRYVPAKSVTVQYQAEVLSAKGRPSKTTFVATAGIRVPEEVPIFAADGIEVAFWEFPNDPFLPGLASATDPSRVSRLLERLGARPQAVQLRTRAYRATRRAVVEASGRSQQIFLKIVRPEAAAALQAAHSLLAAHVPVPHSFGWSEELGIVALQAMLGRTLSKALTARTRRLPGAASLVSLLDRFPEPTVETRNVPGPHEVAPEHARLLRAVAPELTSRIDAIVERLGAVTPEERSAVHGDFHSSQILIDGANVVGLVDVDTAGAGERANDLANVLGHLSTLGLTSPARQDVDRYGASLINDFDHRVDPVGLRLRVAGAVLGLATGPFRVQANRWPIETERRIALAERWIGSAEPLG
ncbi:MAG: aminoglycoside phosphotransferase family protein [Acidimicrobiia bacterium]|nr:aminoglycoside phosphotransferase family protein [Acidimicrobiia bacterium]